MLKTYLAKATENVTTGVKWNHHTVSCTVNGQRLVTCNVNARKVFKKYWLWEYAISSIF